MWWSMRTLRTSLAGDEMLTVRSGPASQRLLHETARQRRCEGGTCAKLQSPSQRSSSHGQATASTCRRWNCASAHFASRPLRPRLTFVAAHPHFARLLTVKGVTTGRDVTGSDDELEALLVGLEHLDNLDTADKVDTRRAAPAG
jgi:hypothetical protein